MPDRQDRRFYPDVRHKAILVFDPRTNEQNIAVHSFNLENPMAGDPTVENATAYLMRSAQCLVRSSASTDCASMRPSTFRGSFSTSSFA